MQWNRRVVVVRGCVAALREKEVLLLDGALAAKRTLPLVGAARPIDITLSSDGERIACCFESGVSLEGRSFSGDDRWGPGSVIAWAADTIWALREPGGELFALDDRTLSVRARSRLEWGDEARFTFVAHPEGHVYAVGAEGQHGAEVHALVLSGGRIVDVALPELRNVFWIACTPSGAHLATMTEDGTLSVRDAVSLAVVESGPSKPALVGFVDETKAVVADDNEIGIVDIAPSETKGAPSVAAALLARVPADEPPPSSGEERGSRLLERLLDEGAIELVKKANRRELGEHLDDLFASRRVTAEALANLLEEHDAVAELFADDETLAKILSEL